MPDPRLKVRKPGFRIGSSFRLAFSDDAQRLATLGRQASVWDVNARRRVSSMPSLPYLSSTDVAPDDARVVVKNTLGDVVVFDAAHSRERLRLLGRPYGEGTEIRFSPCGRYIVDGSWQGDLLVREADTGDIVLHERGKRVMLLACSRDRQTWVYTRGHGDGDALMIRRWPFDEHAPTRLPEIGPVEEAAISDDRRLLVVARGSTLETWRLRLDDAGAESIGRCEIGISGTGVAVDLDRDCTLVATAGAHEAKLMTLELRLRWALFFDYPSDVAFSPDGHLLAVGDWSKGAVLSVPDLIGDR